MHYFSSSALHAAKYDPVTKTLTIWFTSSGRGYEYYNVPLRIWHGLTTASSAGGYFNHFIRDQYAA